MSDRVNPRIAVVVALAALVLGAGLLTGCTKTATEPKLTPKVQPPVVAKAGVLRVAVDTSLPPFAGKDKGTRAGLDIDVASALAARLGLRVRLVEVSASDVTTSLAEGTADIALVGATVDQVDLTLLSVAGSYGLDAPVFFSSKPETLTIDTLDARSVGAQKGSAAYWRLTQDLGEGAVKPYATLREALAALVAGDVDVVAGDAIVGAYITRDMPTIGEVGQVADAQPLAVLVPKDAQQLEEIVRTQLDALSGDGTLDAIMRKWVPDLRTLMTADASATSAPAGPSSP